MSFTLLFIVSRVYFPKRKFIHEDKTTFLGYERHRHRCKAKETQLDQRSESQNQIQNLCLECSWKWFITRVVINLYIAEVFHEDCVKISYKWRRSLSFCQTVYIPSKNFFVAIDIVQASLQTEFFCIFIFLVWRAGGGRGIVTEDYLGSTEQRRSLEVCSNSCSDHEA